jgi:hypothetical protein
MKQLPGFPLCINLVRYSYKTAKCKQYAKAKRGTGIIQDKEGFS